MLKRDARRKLGALEIEEVDLPLEWGRKIVADANEDVFCEEPIVGDASRVHPCDRESDTGPEASDLVRGGRRRVIQQEIEPSGVLGEILDDEEGLPDDSSRLALGDAQGSRNGDSEAPGAVQREPLVCGAALAAAQSEDRQHIVPEGIGEVGLHMDVRFAFSPR